MLNESSTTFGPGGEVFDLRCSREPLGNGESERNAGLLDSAEGAATPAGTAVDKLAATGGCTRRLGIVAVRRMT